MREGTPRSPNSPAVSTGASMPADILTAINTSTWMIGPIIALSAMLLGHLSQRFPIWQCPGFPICSELHLAKRMPRTPYRHGAGVP
jgi:hypothetical protein